MKKILLPLLFVFIVNAIFAQTEQPTTRSKSLAKEKILPYQMGYGQTDQESFTLNFDSPLETEYTVMLTPMSSETTLYIAEQTREKVVIRSANGSSVPFQFIVFIRKPESKTIQPAEGVK